MIDKGNITYENLKENKEQLFTIIATTDDGETVNKSFIFVSKYSKVFLIITNLLEYTCYRQEILPSV